MAKHISIIVVNWNNASDSIACIASLRKIQYASFDIILVDNGSHDGSADAICETAQDITCLRNDRNLGFAGGNNVGIEYALAQGTDAVLLLNNDTIVDPEILNAFDEASDAQSDVGFLAAKIYYHDDPTRLWMGLPHWNPDACRFEHDGINEIDDGKRFTTITEVAYACGCALFAPATTLRRIGLMELSYFCYFEEVDWCLRAADQGLRSYYVPNAKVWHKVSATSGGNQAPIIKYYRTRNQLLLARRQFAGRIRARIVWRVLSDELNTLSWREASLLQTLKRIYWNLLTLQKDPGRTAWRKGIRDYVLRRFGDAPDDVKTLS
jgi:GT2 family glycosyltransferase